MEFWMILTANIIWLRNPYIASYLDLDKLLKVTELNMACLSVSFHYTNIKVIFIVLVSITHFKSKTHTSTYFVQKGTCKLPYMLQEMLIAYKHNTTRGINCLNEGLPNQQYWCSTSQYGFQSTTGFYSPTSQTVGQNHVRHFKTICKQNLTRGWREQ